MPVHARPPGPGTCPVTNLWMLFVVLIGSALVIYFSCELFVNGVEWVGRSLGVGQKATGSVLAAFGTALPESVVTLVAVAFSGNAASKDLGIGAALGGPLALATIAYAMVGVVLLIGRKQLPNTAGVRADFKLLARDQQWFLAVFAVKILLGAVAFAWKPWLGLVFLAGYGLYICKEISGEQVLDDETPEPLTFARDATRPSGTLCMVQTLAALAVIFLASRLFVSRLELLAPRLGMPPQLIALLLSPIATELPETMNAVIWVRQGKYRVALANISGAMMIQATIPTAFGLFWTHWMLGTPLLLAAAVTASAIGTMLVAFRRGFLSRRLLTGMGLFYPLFVALLLGLHLR
jgi:cation:H+ antiporter